MVHPRERGPLHAARTPHYGDEVTSTLRPGSPRASTQSVPPRPRGQSPPHTPPGRACGGKPASPVPLRSTAARPTGPRQPAGMLRTPPPVAAVFRSLRLPAHRAPGKPPHHPQRCDRGGASGGRRGESRICGSRPLHRACEEGASGERVSSRAELARAAAFGVAGSSGTFSTPDPYST